MHEMDVGAQFIAPKRRQVKKKRREKRGRVGCSVDTVFNVKGWGPGFRENLESDPGWMRLMEGKKSARFRRPDTKRARLSFPLMASQCWNPLGSWFLLLSVMRGKGFARIIGLLGFQDPVDQPQQLAHDGDDDHFAGFASCSH